MSCLWNRLTNDVRTLGLSLCPDDISLPLLLCLFDNESRSLGVLLRNLLLLDGPRELLAKSHVRNGDVFEGNIELRGAAQKVSPDPGRDCLTLGDELGRVELRDD